MLQEFSFRFSFRFSFFFLISKLEMKTSLVQEQQQQQPAAASHKLLRRRTYRPHGFAVTCVATMLQLEKLLVITKWAALSVYFPVGVLLFFAATAVVIYVTNLSKLLHRLPCHRHERWSPEIAWSSISQFLLHFSVDVLSWMNGCCCFCWWRYCYLLLYCCCCCCSCWSANSDFLLDFLLFFIHALHAADYVACNNPGNSTPQRHCVAQAAAKRKKQSERQKIIHSR